MNINLHNKYEITINNKTYTAYNTLLNSVYDKISKLEQFTSHIAIGTGTEERNPDDSKLGSYLMSFKTSTDEIQSDITQGALFIKKIVTIDETNTSTFSFSELGLACSNEFDPDIYNHVLLKNQSGEVVSITRNQGEVMEIKVTIYLELSEDSKPFFVEGENELIKRILGEELNEDDNNLYAIRGENIIPDSLLPNVTYDNTKLTICEKSVQENNDGTINVLYSAELGEGDTEEILILFNNKVCLRLNTLNFNEPISNSIISTCKNGNYIPIDKNVKQIDGVYSINDTGNIIHNSHCLINYGNSFSTKINNIFDQEFTHLTPRVVSKDGKMIGFIVDSYLHLYRYNNYNFTKINTINISLDNHKKIIIIKDVIIVFTSTDPYINIYKIVDNIAIKKDINLQTYNASI